MEDKTCDVLVIGAGQAGLAMGYYLSQSNLSYIILDSQEKIGESWRKRYDSLKLFTPRAYSSLPGLSFSGDPEVYPTKDEIAVYLELYANKFSLPVQLKTVVEKLDKIEYGFVAYTNKGIYFAKNVIVAAGPFQKPFIPPGIGSISPTVLKFHSSEYRNPTQIPPGTVLVVGGGNSGAQIAVDLAKTHNVLFSTRKQLTFRPYTILGKSLFWWLDKVGILTAPSNSWIAKKIKAMGDPIIGMELKELLEKGTVKAKPGIESFNQNNVTFNDGTTEQIHSIVWSTGYHSDYGWINIPNTLDEKGNPYHTKGVSPIKGMYYVGLPWQSARDSALLHGVGRDALYIYKVMKNNKL